MTIENVIELAHEVDPDFAMYLVGIAFDDETAFDFLDSYKLALKNEKGFSFQQCPLMHSELLRIPEGTLYFICEFDIHDEYTIILLKHFCKLTGRKLLRVSAKATIRISGKSVDLRGCELRPEARHRKNTKRNAHRN